MIEKIKQYANRIFSSSLKNKRILGAIISAVLVMLIYNMRTTVTVSIDDVEQKIITYNRTVKTALQRNGITLGSKDKINLELEHKLNDSDIIVIKRAVPVEIAVDGEGLKIDTAEDNIKDMLEAENILLGMDDKINLSVDTPITEGLSLKITRVKTEEVLEVAALEFQTVVKNDDGMNKGMTKVAQEGAQGEKEVTVKVVYEDGVEVERVVVAEKVTKEPVNKVIHQGTLTTVALSRGGDNFPYKKSLSVKATAYSGGGRTATGTVPKRNPSGLSTIAVDPRVIPLGTKVYVEGYGFAVAEDTGGAIKSNKIDIYLNSSSECFKWGVRTVNLYIVAYPGQW